MFVRVNLKVVVVCKKDDRKKEPSGGIAGRSEEESRSQNLVDTKV